MKRRTLAIQMAMLSLHCLSYGCSLFSPHWDDGTGRKLRHKVSQAVVYKGRLGVAGTMNNLKAFTDYGVRVNSATDDLGNTLEFKSAQISRAKEMCFELEFSEPPPEATAFHYDLTFTSRTGLQNVTGSIGIERGAAPNYLQMGGSWSREPRGVTGKGQKR